MGGQHSGRKENVYDYSQLGNQLFVPVHEFMMHTGMKYATLCNHIHRRKISSIKNGKSSLVLNPLANFSSHFDALPALLTYTEVCDFFGVKNLSPKLISAIGFFKIYEDNAAVYTDKKSLADFLEEQLCDQ